jgi:16S rRNA processing protein RimM
LTNTVAQELAIGTVVTSFGVNGYVKIKTFSGEYEHIQKLRTVQLRKANRQIKKNVEAVEVIGRYLSMKLEGVDTPEDAKSYRNWEIWVPRICAAPLLKDEFYYADVYHCRVLWDGLVCGTVESIFAGNGTDLLEIKKNDGNSSLVPFSEQFIGEVDIEKKTIELKVDWILE